MKPTTTDKEVLHTQKPLRKNYESQTAISQMMNANEGKNKYVIVDWKNYAKDLEKYIVYLETAINNAKNLNK